MARVVQFRPAFARARVRLTQVPETRAKLAAAIRAIASAPVLPERVDFEAIVPPVLHVYVRRAPGLALWVWFTFDDDVVTLRALTEHPPPAPP